MLWVRVPPEAADFSLKKCSSGIGGLKVCLSCMYMDQLKTWPVLIPSDRYKAAYVAKLAGQAALKPQNFAPTASQL